MYLYVRKEAVLSSQIEGTQSSLSDLLLYESEEVPGVPMDDVVEVSNYVAALNHGLQRLNEGFPLSLRLLREIHGILLREGRGSEKEPGEFRRSQNWIGGTRPGNAVYVPPPPHKVVDCMGALEKFLHDDPVRVPTLLKAGLARAQFETIHPFLDGNGRLGVGDKKKPDYLSDEEAELRRRLRARARALGDERRSDGSHETWHLEQEVAYEHWHRMLFARFLVENDLLAPPDLFDEPFNHVRCA